MPPSDPPSPSSVSPLSEEAIAELERLHAAAQPAPWKPLVLWQDGAYPVGPYSRSEQQSKADAACIAALHNAFPALIAEVRRLRSVIGANYSVQRWTGANIAEVEKERDDLRAQVLAARAERDAALAQRDDAVKRAEKAETDAQTFVDTLGEILRFEAGEGVDDTAKRVVRERDAYRDALEKIAAQGCAVRSYVGSATCIDSGLTSTRCAFCLARAALSAEVK